MEKIEIVSKGVVVRVTVEELDEVRGREISWPSYSQYRLGSGHADAVKRATRFLRNDVSIKFRDVPLGFKAVYYKDFSAFGTPDEQSAPVAVTLRKASLIGGNVEYTEEFEADVAEKLLELIKDYTAIRKLVLDVAALGVRRAVDKALQDQSEEAFEDLVADRPRG